jgi:hypothetical protein
MRRPVGGCAAGSQIASIGRGQHQEPVHPGLRLLLTQGGFSVIATANSDWHPVAVLLHGHSAFTGEFQAGDQGAGDGGPAAQRPFRRDAIDLRQKGRQWTAIRQLSHKRRDVPDRVSGGPQRRRPRAESHCLRLWHAQHRQTGAQQVRQVAAMARGIGVRLRLAAAKHVRPSCARCARQLAAASISARPTDWRCSASAPLWRRGRRAPWPAVSAATTVQSGSPP